VELTDSPNVFKNYSVFKAGRKLFCLNQKSYIKLILKY